MTNHLNYYKKINKIPTIDLADLKEKVLFLQRKNYYFSIGLTQNSFQEKHTSNELSHPPLHAA